MMGLNMMLGSLGLDPAEIRRQVEDVVKGVETVQYEIARQGRVLDAIARANGINPRDFDNAPSKEIEYE